jgi:hypothetical protein
MRIGRSSVVFLGGCIGLLCRNKLRNRSSGIAMLLEAMPTTRRGADDSTRLRWSTMMPYRGLYLQEAAPARYAHHLPTLFAHLQAEVSVQFVVHTVYLRRIVCSTILMPSLWIRTINSYMQFRSWMLTVAASPLLFPFLPRIHIHTR